MWFEPGVTDYCFALGRIAAHILGCADSRLRQHAGWTFNTANGLVLQFDSAWLETTKLAFWAGMDNDIHPRDLCRCEKLESA